MGENRFERVSQSHIKRTDLSQLGGGGGSVHSDSLPMAEMKAN